MKGELAALALKVFHVGWMSVLLALLVEVLVLVLVLLTGNDASWPGVVASVLSRISWSVIVCAALAVTTALQKVAIPASGFAGLVVAPTATVLAKVLQKAITAAFGGASALLPVGVILTLASLKGAEYLLLGSVLAWLIRKDYGFIAAILTGVLLGLLFGIAVSLVNVLMVGLTPSMVFVGFINEMMFPIGCSIILVGADKLARLMAPAS